MHYFRDGFQDGIGREHDIIVNAKQQNDIWNIEMANDELHSCSSFSLL